MQSATSSRCHNHLGLVFFSCCDCIRCFFVSRMVFDWLTRCIFPANVGRGVFALFLMHRPCKDQGMSLMPLLKLQRTRDWTVTFLTIFPPSEYITHTYNSIVSISFVCVRPLNTTRTPAPAPISLLYNSHSHSNHHDTPTIKVETRTHRFTPRDGAGAFCPAPI
jgi:hypothetical protein